MFARADERRREQHMIAVFAVDGAVHRIHHQAALHRLALDDDGVQPLLRIEGLFRCAVPHQFDADEEPTPANIADVRMLRMPFTQRRAQLLAARLHVVEQFVFGDHVLHGKCRRARRRVTDIRVTVLKEEARAADDGVVDRVGHERRANRLIARAEPLRDGEGYLARCRLRRRRTDGPCGPCRT